MKRNFTLILAAFLFVAQSVNAKSIDTKNTSHFLKELSTKAVADSSPNQIFIQLNSIPGGDTPYSFTGTGVNISFDSSFNSNVYEPYDGVAFGGFGELLAIIQGNNDLSIEGRSLPTTKDTVGLLLESVNSYGYQLQIDATTFQGGGLNAFLYDYYLKKATQLNPTQTLYDFTPNANDTSTYQNRFSIIFRSKALLVSNISLNAILKDGNAALAWTTTGENNLESFTIEKSVNGTTYASLDNVAAKNITNAIYSYTDANVANGITYYRIKATSKTGEETFSKVSMISKVAGTGYGIYPNPVRNSTVNLKLTNAVSGSYLVNIYNIVGKKVATKQIEHSGGSANYGLTLDTNLANGLYKVSVLSANSGKAVYETSLLIQK